MCLVSPRGRYLSYRPWAKAGRGMSRWPAVLNYSTTIDGRRNLAFVSRSRQTRRATYNCQCEHSDLRDTIKYMFYTFIIITRMSNFAIIIINIIVIMHLLYHNCSNQESVILFYKTNISLMEFILGGAGSGDETCEMLDIA